jgi:hypothetical protein
LSSHCDGRYVSRSCVLAGQHHITSPATTLYPLRACTLRGSRNTTHTRANPTGRFSALPASASLSHWAPGSRRSLFPQGTLLYPLRASCARLSQQQSTPMRPLTPPLLASYCRRNSMLQTLIERGAMPQPPFTNRSLRRLGGLYPLRASYQRATLPHRTDAYTPSPLPALSQTP